MMTKRIIIFFTTKLKVKETYYDIEKNMYSPICVLFTCYFNQFSLPYFLFNYHCIIYRAPKYAYMYKPKNNKKYIYFCNIVLHL